MSDVYESVGDQDWEYYWSPLITRSILATDPVSGMSAVYAISNAGIRSAWVPHLPAWLATAQFPPLMPPPLTPQP
jgi:hypothetical protein